MRARPVFFIPETTDRVRDMRGLFHNLTIAVDGGVDEKNFQSLKEAGVDDFIIGSALVKANDPRARFKLFQSLL